MTLHPWDSGLGLHPDTAPTSPPPTDSHLLKKPVHRALRGGCEDRTPPGPSPRCHLGQASHSQLVPFGVVIVPGMPPILLPGAPGFPDLGLLSCHQPLSPRPFFLLCVICTLLTNPPALLGVLLLLLLFTSEIWGLYFSDAFASLIPSPGLAELSRHLV